MMFGCKKIVAFETPWGIRFAIQRRFFFFKEYLDIQAFRASLAQGEIRRLWWSRDENGYFGNGDCFTKSYAEARIIMTTHPVERFKEVDLSLVEQEILNEHQK